MMDSASNDGAGTQTGPQGFSTDAIIAIIGATLQLLVRSQATARKDELAWALHSIAQALHQAEGDLGAPGHGEWAQYADFSAQHIEIAARYLHDHDFRAIIQDVDHLAKERPAVLFGAMLGLGVVIGRFFKNTGALAPTKQPSDTKRSA